MISIAQLHKIVPHAGGRADIFLEPLNEAMYEFGIVTPKRQAAFVAQISHESGSLNYVRELASGAAYDTGRLAERLGNTPEADGDGQRYKGRGLIQITGHDNYLRCGAALDLDLLANPELLEQPVYACRSAAWFWQSHGLNELADIGNQKVICKRINGGLNGLDDRINFYHKACEVLGVDSP